MHRMNKTVSPPSIRVTVPVTPSVHASFKRLADAGSMSVGRAMGEWLADTVDAADHMATLVTRARAAPKLVAQEIHAYALGLADQTTDVLKGIRARAEAERAGVHSAPARTGSALVHPPVGNTGVKPTKTHPKGRGGSKS